MACDASLDRCRESSLVTDVAALTLNSEYLWCALVTVESVVGTAGVLAREASLVLLSLGFLS